MADFPRPDFSTPASLAHESRRRRMAVELTGMVVLLLLVALFTRALL